jgi:uncharacterized protein
MALLETIKADLLAARKLRDPSIKGRATVGLLTALTAEAAAVGKNAGDRPSTDEEVIRTVKKFVGNAEETKKLLEGQFEKEIGPLDGVYAMPASKLTDDMYSNSVELRLLNAYLPRQMSEEDLTKVVSEFLQAGGSGMNPNMGTVMAYLKANFAGQYDGKIASAVAKRVLS